MKFVPTYRIRVTFGLCLDGSHIHINVTLIFRSRVLRFPNSDTYVRFISDHLCLKCLHHLLPDALFSQKSIGPAAYFIRGNESAGMNATVNWVLESTIKI